MELRTTALRLTKQILKFIAFIVCNQGRIQGGGTPSVHPPKIGKNMIFWCKIMLFHMKYPNKFRTSLRSPQFF